MKIRCPRCQTDDPYVRTSIGAQGYCKFICANTACRHHFSETSGSWKRSAKKPEAWYQSILDLYFQGLNARQISLFLKMKDTKSVYRFLLRWRAAYALTID